MDRTRWALTGLAALNLFLLGCLLGRSDLPVLANGTDRGGRFIVATERSIDNVTQCYILDEQTQRLCVYEIQGQKMKIKAIRQIEFDVQIAELNNDNPPGLSVGDLKREVERRAKEEEAKKKADEKKKKG